MCVLVSSFACFTCRYVSFGYTVVIPTSSVVSNITSDFSADIFCFVFSERRLIARRVGRRHPFVGSRPDVTPSLTLVRVRSPFASAHSCASLHQPARTLRSPKKKLPITAVAGRGGLLRRGMPTEWSTKGVENRGGLAYDWSGC